MVLSTMSNLRKRQGGSLLLLVLVVTWRVNPAASSSSSSTSSAIKPPRTSYESSVLPKIPPPPPPPPRPKQKDETAAMGKRETTVKGDTQARPPPPPPPPLRRKEMSQQPTEDTRKEFHEARPLPLGRPLGQSTSTQQLDHVKTLTSQDSVLALENLENELDRSTLDPQRRDDGHERKEPIQKDEGTKTITPAGSLSRTAAIKVVIPPPPPPRGAPSFKRKMNDQTSQPLENGRSEQPPDNRDAAKSSQQGRQPTSSLTSGRDPEIDTKEGETRQTMATPIEEEESAEGPKDAEDTDESGRKASGSQDEAATEYQLGVSDAKSTTTLQPAAREGQRTLYNQGLQPGSVTVSQSTAARQQTPPQEIRPPFGVPQQQQLYQGGNLRQLPSQYHGIRQDQHVLADTRTTPQQQHEIRPSTGHRLYPSGHPPSQYQQYPSQQARGPRAKPASRNSSKAPVFQSLWSRVEKGLDGLVDLEDAIAGSAQRLMNGVVPSHRGKRSSSSSSSNRPSPKRPGTSTTGAKAPPPKFLSGPQQRWQNQKKITEQRKAPTAGTATAKPLVSVYRLNSETSASKKKAFPNDENGSTRSTLPPNARKLMPANGGASSPNNDGGGSWSYPSELRFSQQSDQQDSSVRDNDSSVRDSEGPTAQDNEKPSDIVLPALRRVEPPQQQDSMYYQQQQQQQQLQPPNPKQAEEPNRAGPGQRGSSASQAPPSRQPEWQQQKNQQSTRRNPWPATASTQSDKPRRPQRPAPTSRAPLYMDDDDDEKPSAIARFLGSIPVPSVGRIFRFGRGKVYNDYASLDAWDAAEEAAKPTRRMFGFFRKQKGSTPEPVRSSRKTGKQAVVAHPVQQLLERSSNGKSTSLLSADNKKSIRGIGQSRALLDIITLCFIVAGFRQLQGLENIPLPQTFSEFSTVSVPNLLEAFILSLDTWAPIAFAAALLTAWTNSLLYDRRILERAEEVGDTAESEARYSRLYLRLVSSTAVHRHLPKRIFHAARLQGIALAETSRLQAFITYAMATIIVMTFTFIKPLFLCVGGAVLRAASLEEIRTWPVPLKQLMEGLKAIFFSASKDLASLFEVQLKGAGHHPLQVAFKASILCALFAVSYLPALEKRRKMEPNDDEEEDTEEAARKMAEQIINLGGTSATRLSFTSKRGWSESVIERWRLAQDESSALVDYQATVGSLLRRIGYYISSWLILAAPLLIFGLVLHIPLSGWWGSSRPMSPWESLLELSVLLLFTNGLVWQTMTKVVESRDLHPDIPGFLTSLSQASSEMESQATTRPLHGSVNPLAGLVVKDLWSAHVFKRAWAVRGAHLSCRSGEVVVVLGDDGAGKSRLLTTLAESIVSPPKQALTATKVRGNISVGGIDVTQWDRNDLRKRVGLCLTDVTSLALRASMWSGLSLEEILEPGDRMRITDPTHTTGPVEKACVVMALKITGLYWSLLPRLPSKLSTVLTASEEDLRPSALRPRYTVISPSDWSKLLLAQVLAQALYDNENASGSADRIDGRLTGSVLLLDDGTSMLSEVEELKLLRDLRQTGASTVLSSSKWATGRLADRIMVVKDGAIVETGTHNELLSRGPQQSLYAARWHAMTSS